MTTRLQWRVFRKRSLQRQFRHRPLLEALEERCLLSSEPILPNLPPAPQLVASTVPANGDVNPYGVAFVPPGFPTAGPLRPGDVLVSNFNNSANQQGTGTTIVRVTPQGQSSLFFQGSPTPGALGLTTALGTLKRGFVLVGSVPTLDGTSATIQAPGSLLILDQNGNVVTTLSDSVLLDGPWDLAIHDQGEKAQVFVSNVLNGTVTRIDLKISEHGDPIVESETGIASGYVFRTDPAALVIGPTGLAYDADHDLLYVASTGDNAIFAIARAKRTGHDEGMGTVVYQDNAHLRGPLGLALTPNGDLITTNGDAVNPDPNFPSEMVEFTPQGQFVDQVSVDSSGQGGAFGIALDSSDRQINLAAVDDIANTLEVWTINLSHHTQPAVVHLGASPSGVANLAAQQLLVAAADVGRTNSPSQLAPSQGSSLDGPALATGKPLMPLPDRANVVPTPTATREATAPVSAAHKARVDLVFGDPKLGLFD